MSEEQSLEESEVKMKVSKEIQILSEFTASQELFGGH